MPAADPPPPSGGLRTGIAGAYRRHIDVRRRSALNAWLFFVVTFLILRFITYGIRYGFLPLHNVETGSGLHIHHFVWGIFILLIVGFAGVMIEDDRWHPWLAAAFGIGAALVIDEFALWLNLKDVYWAQQGRWSVDLAIVVASLLGLFYAADRFWREVVGELARAARRLARRGPRGTVET
ncbi:MAG TPA: hypothetical protein VH134_02650 [Candidatus Dormibacteraeota bacterium]|jgi:hypothetical protein|nr:hypothetical protein [Candidatus Dormibacteraeota bacterium]